MSEADEYLQNNTFFCSILKARITKQQCRANCNTAAKQFRYLRTMKWIDEEDVLVELEEAGLWDRSKDTATVKCIGCPEFVPPIPQSMRTRNVERIKRYPDTPSGRVERKLIAYRTHSQEHLNEEEYRYLSAAPPASADVSELHHRPEKMGSSIHSSIGTIQTDEGEFE